MQQAVDLAGWAQTLPHAKCKTAGGRRLQEHNETEKN